MHLFSYCFYSNDIHWICIAASCRTQNDLTARIGMPSAKLFVYVSAFTCAPKSRTRYLESNTWMKSASAHTHIVELKCSKFASKFITARQTSYGRKKCTIRILCKRRNYLFAVFFLWLFSPVFVTHAVSCVLDRSSFILQLLVFIY